MHPQLDKLSGGQGGAAERDFHGCLGGGRPYDVRRAAALRRRAHQWGGRAVGVVGQAKKEAQHDGEHVADDRSADATRGGRAAHAAKLA